jgi:4-amino-4-deoxy-L-arabinose transferase-like glycosyltransferase
LNLRAILIVVAIINFILPLSLSPLFDLDEGAFSEATREMLQSGNYLTTYLDGALRFDKPILIYWLQAFSVKLFGLNEFALRLPSAIAGLLWAFAIYAFSKKEFGQRVAYYSTLFMLSALQINIITKAAIADSLLNLFIATSIFSIWIFLKEGNKKYLYFSFLLIALGALTKGPVAVMVPLVTLLIYMVIKKRFIDFLKIIFNPIGIAIFLAVTLPWYILEYLDQGQKFINGFFLKHNLQRFNSTFESHRGSYFYYIPVLLLGFLPFSTLLVKSLAKTKSLIKSDLNLFLLIWFSFVFIFFSFSGTKLPHYIIYGYTPLFIIMGLYASNNFKHLSIATISPTIILYILLFALPFIAPFIEPKNLYVKDILSGVSDCFGVSYLGAITLVIILTVAIYKANIKLELKSALYATFFTVVVNFVVIAAYGKLVQLPLKEAALYAKEHKLKVIRYGITMPSFLVYLEDKSLKQKPTSKSVVITKSKALKDFKNYKVLYSKRGIYLIELK